MPVTIIVEDGSNVPGSNSYVSVAEYREYASNRGVVLPASEDVVGSQLIRAMDYLEIQPWRGAVTYIGQSLDFPRSGVRIGGSEIDDESIPDKIKFAQMQLALQVNAGVELFPVVGGATQVVAREKVGPLETQYSTNNVGTQPYFRSVSKLLAPYISSPGFAQFRAVRG